jgi:hypothetical protein
VVIVAFGSGACNAYDNIAGSVKKPQVKVGTLREDYKGNEFPPEKKSSEV